MHGRQLPTWVCFCLAHHVPRSLDCRLHVVVAGRPKAGQPPRRLLLFVHGFPEGHFSWRHQLTVG